MSLAAATAIAAAAAAAWTQPRFRALSFGPSPSPCARPLGCRCYSFCWWRVPALLLSAQRHRRTFSTTTRRWTPWQHEREVSRRGSPPTGLLVHSLNLLFLKNLTLRALACLSSIYLMLALPVCLSTQNDDAFQPAWAFASSSSFHCSSAHFE